VSWFSKRSNGGVRVPPAVVAVAVIAGVATALVRYLGLEGFSNDHFQYLAAAQQIRLGEWPTRDFADPGMPLMYAASAAAQVVFGRSLFAEAMLMAIVYGVTSALIVIAAWRASRSLIVAVLACVLCVMAFPLPASYPRALLYALGPLTIWAWVRRPTGLRLFAIALLVGVAYLFRQEHGLHLGLAALVTVALAPAATRVMKTRLVMLCVLILLVLLPYAIYIQRSEGIFSAAWHSWQFSQREADRTELHLAAYGSGDAVRLYYLFQALPLIAAAIVVLDVRRGRHEDALIGAPLAVLAFLASMTFLRDPLPVRLPEAIVPAALVGAWLVGRGLRIPSLPLRSIALTAAAVLMVVAASSVVVVGRTQENLARTNLSLGLSSLPQLVRDRTAQLKARYDRQQLPDGRILSLVGLFDYLDRCTTPSHRLLVAGNAPEIYVYAQRPFAAGHSTFLEGYYQSEAEQQQMLDRARQQVVAFAVMLSDQESSFHSTAPGISAFIDANFRPLTEIPTNSDRTVRVMVRSGLPPLHADATTGWPCYR
jgi:hypothetical protein